MTESDLIARVAEVIESVGVEKRSRAHALRYHDARGRTPKSLPERSFTLGTSAVVESSMMPCVYQTELMVSIYYQSADGVEGRAADDARAILRTLPAAAGTPSDLWDLRPYSAGVEELDGQIIARYSVIATYLAEV